MGRITRQENARKFGNFDRWPWPLTVDQAVDRFVGAGNLKRPPTLHFSPVFLHTLKTLHIPATKSQFWQDLIPFPGCGVDFGTFWVYGFDLKPRVSVFRGDFSLTVHLKLGFSLISVRLGLRVGVCYILFDFILPLDFSFSLSRSLDGSKARDGDLQGSRQAPYWAISAWADGGSPKGELWHDPL